MTLREHDLLYWGRQEGIALGISQGARETALKNARKALEMNLSVEQVSEITSLTLEEVMELTKDISSK